MKTMSSGDGRRSLLGALLSGAGASPAPLITFDREVRCGRHH
jgi:hypothetical protein